MSLKLKALVDGSKVLQDGVGNTLLTFDASGNAAFANELSDQDGRLGFGVGQSWQNVTASRSLGVTYTNSTGKPIVIAIEGSSGSIGSGLYVSIDGGTTRVAARYTANSNPHNSSDIIIPPGSTYEFTDILSFSPSAWWELR